MPTAKPLPARPRKIQFPINREPAPRPDDFRADPRTVARIEPADYTRSGYDRGHMAPNYGVATRFGRQAQEETFLMSNISPQKHALNAGLSALPDAAEAALESRRAERAW